MKEDFIFTVIIPVYNVEKYLAETLDSVILQTVGFKENIQIILVNDGSTDRSGDICFEYVKKYPDNISYIEKENGGVSSARNEAIPYIRGKYVNFLDADDCWKNNAFECVMTFFDEHYDKIDAVGCRKEFFGAKSGYHYLDYKFEKTRVIDLRKEFDCIQLDVTGAFIKAKAIGERRFSEKLKYGEDAQFITSLLIKKRHLGVCREAVHRYRKRDDMSSALQNDVKGMKIGVPKDYFLDGIDEEVKEKVLAAAEKFRELGAEIEYFDLGMVKYAIPAYYIIACAEASSNLERFDGVKYGYRTDKYTDLNNMYKKTRSEGFGDEVKRRIMLGSFVLSSGYFDAYYVKALKVKALIKQAFDRAFEKYDVVLGPVAPTTALKIGESLSDPIKMYLGDVYTVSINLTGIPAVSLPCGYDKDGLPIGLQLMGQTFDEKAVIKAAYSFEQNFKVDLRHSPLYE